MACFDISMEVWVLQNSQVSLPVAGENFCGAPQEGHVKFIAVNFID
jgi:hypothetical protein